MSLDVHCVHESRDGLGEAPLWVEEEGALCWSDHVGCCMKRWSPESGEVRVWQTPGPIGSFALRRGGGMMGASDDGFLEIDLEAGRFVPRVDPEAGVVSNRRPFFSTAGRPGMVDGGTVDAEGYYWCALVAGGRVLRIDPEGRVVLEIEMPVPRPTCPAFGGPDLDRLYVTSQRLFLTAEELAAYPQSGNLFVIEGLGIEGLPEARFAG